MDKRSQEGRYRKKIKQGFAVLAVLLLSVLLVRPMAVQAESDSVELVASFDKNDYAAGDMVTVSFTVYGSDFDAAGFHVTYDTNRLTYQDARTGSGFSMPVRKVQNGELEVTVQSTAVQKPGSEGIVVAEVTFTAVTGGEQSLSFTGGSKAYLEGKEAVVYNDYQVLEVNASVTADAAADASLRRAKAAAAEQLQKDIDSRQEAG